VSRDWSESFSLPLRLGANALTDAFNVAFRIPNLFRRLFAEGAFSQAFVPVLAASKAQNGEEATRKAIDHVATLLAWALLILSVLGVFLAPWLVWAMASGLQQQPDAYASAVHMTRWMFPYIGFMSLVALSAGILNTWKRFAIPAATPVLLNMAMIAAAWLLAPWLKSKGIEAIYALPVGVMLGGFLQLAIQIPALKSLGLLPKLGVSWRAIREATQGSRFAPNCHLDVARFVGRGRGSNLPADQYPNCLSLGTRQRELADLCRPTDGISNGDPGRGFGCCPDASIGRRAGQRRPERICGDVGLGLALGGGAGAALCCGAA
jgi:hypothetical protein